MINLQGNPFFLDQEGVNWVENTLANMSVQEKIGQIFCNAGFTDDKNILKQITSQMGIGGIMYRTGPAESIQETHRFLQENSKIPMLIAANLEAGGIGITTDGTSFANPLQVAATNNAEMGYRLGKIACAEGAAVGCNWSFAPIVDIDMNFRNPITNLRTFGSDKDLVIQMAEGYLKAADEEGLAVSIKHFPGDGVDERDQHLLASVNSLSTEEWDNSYGEVYQTLINKGAKTVMVGHISQPAYSKKLNPNLKDNEILPASLSKELLNGLLREKLNFNGLIVTDASLMIGFTAVMRREKAVPYSIAAGNDMFLFTKNLEEDFAFMFKGYQEGILTDERLNQAVTRILATKASLNLHTKQKEGTLVPNKDALKILNSEEFINWTKECADQSVTLVKDTQNLLPISPEKHKRVYLNVLESNKKIDSPTRKTWKALLEKEGFEVTLRNRDVEIDLQNLDFENLPPAAFEIMAELQEKTNDFAAKYDLVIYVADFQTASNNTVIRINWNGFAGMGNDAPWFVEEIPTMFISSANPYHLLDTPMIKTFINSYTNNKETNEAVIEKIMGRSEFKGQNPVDPFCEREDTKY